MKTNSQVQYAFNNGKFAEGGHIKTDGKTLISYRTIVAQRQDNGKTLQTSRYYSVTTQRHLSGIMADYIVPFVERPTTEEHAHNYKYLCDVAEGYARKAERARKDTTRHDYTRQAEDATITAQAYLADFIVSVI